MKHYPLTVLGLALSALVFAGALAFDLDLFEHTLQFLQSIEHFEADELVIPLLIFMPFFLVDTLRRNRHHRIEHEKAEIHRAMVRSTHHVLNNFLNQLQWFKMVAEDTPGFDRKVLELYDHTIHDAARQVRAMGNIRCIDSAAIEEAVAPRDGAPRDTE